MRRVLFRRASLLAAVAVLAGACDKPTSTTPTPTATGVTVTETFIGHITLNGAAIFPFTVGSAGSVSATVTSIDPNPDGLATIDLSVGVWSGTSCGGFANENNAAGTGAVLLETVAGSGTLCARVADPNGQLVNPVTFTISLVHF